MAGFGVVAVTLYDRHGLFVAAIDLGPLKQLVVHEGRTALFVARRFGCFFADKSILLRRCPA